MDNCGKCKTAVKRCRGCKRRVIKAKGNNGYWANLVGAVYCDVLRGPHVAIK